MEFERPSRRNVEIGDLLVLSSANGSRSKNVCLVDITGVGEHVVSYARDSIPHNSSFDNETPYRNAVILKRDGRYLIGDLASFHYEQRASSL